MLKYLFARLSNSAARFPTVKSRRAPTGSIDGPHGVVPAAGTSASSVLPPSQVTFLTKTMRAHRAAPLGHDSSSATGTRASSALSPCRGSNSAMGTRAPNAAPLIHGTETCASRAAPRHASRSKKAAVTARRPPKRACSSPLLLDPEVAVGLRCG